MIEKKIHYVWMGKGKKSNLILACMDSWKQHLSEFEIIEWNEDNFDINSNKYVKEAYDSKKWAFVSDYVRLYVLYNYGGIYLDTDIEILKPIDKFLEYSAFSGFESDEYILTGFIGATKGHTWIYELLRYYDNRSFIYEDGSLDLSPNVVNITKTTVEKYGLVVNGDYQILNDDLHIYPKDYFCPSDYGDSYNKKMSKITENSYSIHHYDGSWLSLSGKVKARIRGIIGKSTADKLKDLLRKDKDNSIIK